MSRARPKVFTVSPGEPFLDVLIARLLDGTLIEDFPAPGDPLALARATILLPTRRACRALEAALLARADAPLLLPRIRPLGDIDADDLLFEEPDEAIEGPPDLPRAIRPLDRRVRLTRLVLALARRLRDADEAAAPASPADAAFLAGELARLMDMVATEGRDWARLDDLPPRELQAHWEVSLRFLSIATEAWPAYLRDNDLIEPAERRRLLLEAEAARLSRLPPEPVIAAGSTGSIPATARLLVTIAKLPRGAVVLPGLDRDLDPASWDALLAADDNDPEPVPSHPQASLRRLLHRMDRLTRAEVGVLTLGEAEGPVQRARARLLSEAMRPAETSDAWARPDLSRAALAPGLAGVALIEATNEHEEALTIACVLREALEHPGSTAALVTPDRILARRVAAELTRFGIAIDDTSGQPLSETPAGLFARLIAEVVRDSLGPVGLLALLEHPLARFGLSAALARAGARALERLVLRGPRPAPGTAGLNYALDAPARGTQAARGLSPADVALARDLADRLIAALAPLEVALTGEGERDVASLLALHAAAIDDIARDPDGSDVLRAGEDGRALRLFLDELADSGADGLAIPPAEYPALFASLMGGRAVRRTAPADPRLKIYGLLEARLNRPDRIVLGGLNEGVWPPATRTDPWLSRTMRADLGLPAPERRIGLSAHDFVQGMGAEEVVLSRALKSGGTPTVPSRWLQRIEAVMGAAAMAPLRARGDAWLEAARALDAPSDPPSPISAPEPRPPLAARPRRLSVTAIETLIRDPYAIHARHILKLVPFEGIDEEPGAGDRGTLIHAALHRYTEAVNRGAPAGVDLLLALGREAFEEVRAFPELQAFWWPRFARIAEWFATFDAARRARGARIEAEIAGGITLALPGGPFEIAARADRIEQGPDGTVKIVDYKTGRVPSKNEVLCGLSPQLPLEAALLTQGAFAERGFSPSLTPSELLYVELKGGAPPAREQRVVPEDGSVADLAAKSLDELRRLLSRFDDSETPYRSLAASRFRPRTSDYDHLARLREWGLAAEEGSE